MYGSIRPLKINYIRMKTIVCLAVMLVFTGCSKLLITGSGPKISYHNKQYNVIKAGNQYWMAENLATDTYRNGEKIQLITDYDIWPELNTPGCGYYKNDTANLSRYGLLYNWYAVDAGKLCPAGWRVPSHEDWNKLEETLGGQFRAGGKMKAVSGWKGRLVSGNDIEFNAVPGGYRLNNDFLAGYEAIWWSSTIADTRYFQKVKMDETYRNLVGNTYVWGRKISYTGTTLYSTLNLRNNGFSVRCVKAKKEKKMTGPPVK
jgi:uncharacterized protein (TIGR02145 family)